MTSTYDLERFVDAQASTYARALKELENGQKVSHWMWFIFPQLKGLGRSPTAQHYGISGVAEAVAYLAHPLLGPRLEACCRALQRHDGKGATAIFGDIDALKLKSSLTLFARASHGNALYTHLLDCYFDGEDDPKTLELLGA